MESGAATPSLGHVGRHQLFPLSLTARGASDAQRRSSQPSSLEDPKGNRIQEGQGAGLRSVRHRVQGEPEGLDRVWALLCCGPYHSAVLFVSLRVQETPVFFLGCLDEIFYNQSDKEVVHLGTDDFLEDRMSFQSMGGTSQSERVWPEDLEKAEEPEIKLPTCWIIEKASKFQKNIFCCIDYAKAFDCVDHNKLWKILKEMGIPEQPDLAPEICIKVKKQQL